VGFLFWNCVYCEAFLYFFIKKLESALAKMGTPTKYRKIFADQAFVACSEGGFTDAKLAKLFKVNKITITRWKHVYPDFCTSIKTGKEKYDTENVEKSLLRRAMGYRNVETYRELDPKNPEKLKVVKTVAKNVIPDVGAQKFWLRNRNRERWPDTQTTESTLKISHEEMLDELE